MRVSGIRIHCLTRRGTIEANEKRPRTLAILTNARSRLQQQVYYCVALMRDPKLRLFSQSGRSLDFARKMEQILLEENPASAKLVKEAQEKEKEKPSNGTESIAQQKKELTEPSVLWETLTIDFIISL